MSKTSKLLADWVKRGLEKPGKSGKGLATHLGLSESSVSRIHTVPEGEKLRSIKAEELPKIAAYLEEDVPIQNGQNVTAARNGRPQAILSNPQASSLVRVSAVIAPSVWREVGVAVVIAERVPASPDTRVAGLKQYACKIEADAARFAICVPYAELRSKPMANDIVHVRRTRHDHYEDTLRVVRIVNGDVKLQLDGASPKDKASFLDYPVAKSGEPVEIKGLVVGFFNSTVF